MFRFASPYFLILLVFIPVLIYHKFSRFRVPVINVSSIKAIRKIRGSFLLKMKWVFPLLKYAAFCALIIALARPQWGTRQVDVLTEGVNIILAVDISESMAALDFKRDGRIVNRLEAVKGVIGKFVAKRDQDRIGMVVFGTNAYTQTPLTRDYNTIVTILDRIEIGAAGPSTAIGDAIGISLKRIEDIESKSNIIILLTDGESNAGKLSPEMASKIAAEKKIKIYTIGVGSKGKAPFLIKHPLWGEQYVYQKVSIDEGALKDIAKKTGGLYFRAEDTDGLEQIYEKIDEMEKTKVEVKTFTEYREYYSYLLFSSIVLLGFWIIVTNTRYLRVP